MSLFCALNLNSPIVQIRQCNPGLGISGCLPSSFHQMYLSQTKGQSETPHQLLPRLWTPELGRAETLAPPADGASRCPLLLADIYRLHPGGCEPLPAALHLLARAHPPVHQQEDRGDAPPHLRHRRQLLLQHETQQPGPVLYHQVGGPAASLPVREASSAALLTH